VSARERAKSRRRGEILAAARQLMREAGDPGFSMRALADQSGVSIATPYNLFGSKQAILLALLDADLAEYREALEKLDGNRIEVLFRAMALMTDLLGQEADLYRNVIAAVSHEGGPEFRALVAGPRYMLWKRLLREATEAGELRADVDPDALAITASQLAFSHTLEWAHGTLALDEMDARIAFGLAINLLGIATDASRARLEHKRSDAERRLQAIWRRALELRLEAGPLEDDERALVADQLRHLEHQTNNRTIKERSA
jgi:AcrR family transcriptional regulator